MFCRWCKNCWTTLFNNRMSKCLYIRPLWNQLEKLGNCVRMLFLKMVCFRENLLLEFVFNVCLWFRMVQCFFEHVFIVLRVVWSTSVCGTCFSVSSNTFFLFRGGSCFLLNKGDAHNMKQKLWNTSMYIETFLGAPPPIPDVSVKIVWNF